MERTSNEEPGTEGVVPFRFSCKRSGNCCRVTGGFAWVEGEELEPLALAAGLELAQFVERHIRQVSDPVSGELRMALRDGEESRCSLLEGANHCSVYDARPSHCRQFPFWASVLNSREGFERAHATCPGLEPLVASAVRDEAFSRLEAVYREVDAFIEKAQPVCIVRGVCCRFEEADHQLYATGLEADFAAAREPEAPAPEAEGRCPYHVAGRCTARSARPLGCRTYFCDTRTTSVLEEANEFFSARIQEIERELDYPHSFVRFPSAMLERGVGTSSGELA